MEDVVYEYWCLCPVCIEGAEGKGRMTPIEGGKRDRSCRDVPESSFLVKLIQEGVEFSVPKQVRHLWLRVGHGP